MGWLACIGKVQVFAFLSYLPVRDVLDNHIEKTTRGIYRWTCWTNKCKGDQHNANTAINVNIVLVRGRRHQGQGSWGLNAQSASPKVFLYLNAKF